jgi:N-acylneuraminate cytidylyltransferase
VTTLAIIPARGGSKRIPRKNIRLFCGKPIIGYTIESAIESGCFDEVMVSTDDDEIAKIAKEFKACVPFMRTKENSNDFAGIADVIIEVLNVYSEMGKNFKYVCCLLPTAPLIKSSDISESFKLLIENNYDTVFPIVRFSYPIQRGLNFESGKVTMLWPENYLKRSQDFSPVFHDCGQFYWVNINSFLNDRKLFTSNSGGFELPENRVQDIDTEDDWQLCEMKYTLQNRK